MSFWCSGTIMAPIAGKAAAIKNSHMNSAAENGVCESPCRVGEMSTAMVEKCGLLDAEEVDLGFGQKNGTHDSRREGSSCLEGVFSILCVHDNSKRIMSAQFYSLHNEIRRGFDHH
jgi:hypothetical protein